MKTVLKNGNVFYQNKIQKLDVEIDGETISQIGHDLDGENIIDCTDLLVTPGFVDLHVHLREPGFEGRSFHCSHGNQRFARQFGARSKRSVSGRSYKQYWCLRNVQGNFGV